ncbi:MAG: DUF1585 domain-containing protein [Planctomycetota bacterium]
MKRPQNFATTLSEKLMTYALGRIVEPADGPEIRRIVDRAQSNGFRFSEIVTGIVLSQPFRYRQTVPELSKRPLPR